MAHGYAGKSGGGGKYSRRKQRTDYIKNRQKYNNAYHIEHKMHGGCPLGVFIGSH